MADVPMIPTQAPFAGDVQSSPGFSPILSSNDAASAAGPRDGPETPDRELVDPQTPSAASVSVSVEETPVSKMLTQGRPSTHISNQFRPTAPQWSQRAQVMKNELGLVGFSFMPANLKAVPGRPLIEKQAITETFSQRSDNRGHRHTVSESSPSARAPECPALLGPDGDPTGRIRNSDTRDESKQGSNEADFEVVPTDPGPTVIENVLNNSGRCQAHTRPGDMAYSELADMERESPAEIDFEGHESELENIRAISDRAMDAASPQQDLTTLKSLDGTVVDVIAHDCTAETSSASTAVKHRTKAAGRRPIHSSRVCKTPVRNSARRVQSRATPAHAATNTQQPSEEDLLYMLMSRARETTTAMKRLAHLEQQNMHLTREKEVTAQALDEAMKAQTQGEQQQTMLRSALDGFKEKYYKLKNWALEANKDCEALQTKALGFTRSIDELNKDRNELLARLRDAQSASRETYRQLKHIRSEVRDTNAVARTTISTVHQMDGVLLAQTEHLRTEKQRCRKLEAHIMLMEHERNKQDTRRHTQSQLLAETLQGISKQLEALAHSNCDKSAESSQLMECKTMLRTLLDKGMATNSGIDSLREVMGSMKDLLDAEARSSSQTFQAAVEALKKELQTATSAQAATLLSEFQSGNKKLTEAREEIARLHQQSQQTDGILEYLRDGKGIAESREKHMQATTERLIAALGDNQETHQKQITDLENRISSLLTKWQSACSQLAQCKHQNEERQVEIEGLKAKLLETETSRQTLQQQLEKVRVRIVEVQTSAEQDCKNKLDRKELQLCQLQDELNREQGERKVKEEEITRLAVSLSEIQRSLEKGESERVAAVAESIGLQTKVAELEANLALTQQNKEKLAQTNKLLEDKSAEITELKHSLKDFVNLKEDLITQQREVHQKDVEIETFSEQVRQLQQKSADFEERLQHHHVLATEKTTLEKELAAARQKLGEMANLKDELHQRNMTVVELETVLAVAQKTAAGAQELQGQNSSLNAQIASLTSDLEVALKENEQIGSLRETVRDREDAAVQLKERLGAHEAQTEEINGMKEALQRKEEEIATLQQQILHLEGAVSNSRLDRQLDPVPNPRRVADRSGVGAGQPLGAEYHVDHNVLSHQLIDIIPETQLDRPQDDQESQEKVKAQQARDADASTSELSEYTSNDSDPEHGIRKLVRKKHETRHAHKHLQKLPQPEDSGPQSHLQVAGRTPSSSYGSLSDQMLLDSVAHRDSQPDNLSPLLSDAEDGPVHTHADADLSATLSWDRRVSKRNPRALRSGSRTRTRESIPFPDPTPEPRLPRESTPAIMRERYQPNSAAKRRVEHNEDMNEHEGQSRRLKRRPANLDIRPPRSPTQKSPTGDQGASRATVGFRKSSSVVGTNAPAPGKSQRTSKPARRGSRQDKYTTRFAS